MDAHSLPSLTAVISTMEALSDAAKHQAHAQASPNFQLQSATLSFSAEAFDLNQLLGALPFPRVKELTLHIDSENLRWKESGSMLAFAVEEFSKASSSIPVRFPDLVKLRFRFRDREGAVPAYLLAMADTRSSAASRLADTLQLPYSVLVSERGRLSDIEFWCKSSGHPGGELGILRASIARGKWEIMESFNPHLEEDWKLHSAQYELRQCFTIPMEPLSVIEERWRDI
ncbi:hypothetical protein DL93DRAFT_2087571 [Clavulina sp. PMI_390]|nr:hypothetical protein DL93DRAFT_2087571 [Clavulina sp. PMI_390]